jgi:hypothetical protein
MYEKVEIKNEAFHKNVVGRSLTAPALQYDVYSQDHVII